MAFVQQGDSHDNSISPSNMSHHSSFLPLPSVFFSPPPPPTSTFFSTSSTGASFNKLCTYSCFHLLHACCLVSLSRLWSLLTSYPSSSVSSTWWAFCTRINTFGVKNCSPPPSLSNYVKGRLFKCFSMSMITVSSFWKLRVVLPYVL